MIIGGILDTSFETGIDYRRDRGILQCAVSQISLFHWDKATDVELGSPEFLEVSAAGQGHDKGNEIPSAVYFNLE